MSDDSNSELPLPPPKSKKSGEEDSDSDSGSSSSSSSSSSSNSSSSSIGGKPPMTDIPTPSERSIQADRESRSSDDDDDENIDGGGVGKEALEEIPIPGEEPAEDVNDNDADPDIDIPLPPDSSKYSPSQALSAEDDSIGISTSSESKKSAPAVLGKAQAKKRLLAFSAAKLASSSPVATVSAKKVTPTKASLLQQKPIKLPEHQPLAIEAIVQEETKMKEILAMNTILNQKLKQVNAITHNLPILPPATAIVKPTIISTPISSSESVNSTSKLETAQNMDPKPKSPERSRYNTENIRKSGRSSRSPSRSPERNRKSTKSAREGRRSSRSPSRSPERNRKSTKSAREGRRSSRSPSKSPERNRKSTKSAREGRRRSRSGRRTSGLHANIRKGHESSRSGSSSPEVNRKSRKARRASRSISKSPERMQTSKDFRSARKSSRSPRHSSHRSRSRSQSSKPVEKEKASPLSKTLKYEVGGLIPIQNKSGLKVDYPGFLVRKTKTKPSLMYGFSPLCNNGYYKTRETVFQEEDTVIVDAMNEIINSKSSAEGTKSPGRTQSREWFSSQPQSFCPSAGSRGILISHLYSDEENDESPVPSKNGIAKSKEISKSVPSSKSDSSKEEQHDLLDSPPSPLLKKKYEVKKKVAKDHSPPKKSASEESSSENDDEPVKKKSKKVKRTKESKMDKSKKTRDKSPPPPPPPQKSTSEESSENDEPSRKKSKKVKKKKESKDKSKKTRGKSSPPPNMSTSEESSSENDEPAKKKSKKVKKKKESKKDKSKKTRDKSPPPSKTTSQESSSENDEPAKKKLKKVKRKKESKDKSKKMRGKSTPPPKTSTSDESSSENDEPAKKKSKKVKKKKESTKERSKKTRDKSPPPDNKKDRGGSGGAGASGKGDRHTSDKGSSRSHHHDRNSRSTKDDDRDRRSSYHRHGRRRGVNSDDEGGEIDVSDNISLLQSFTNENFVDSSSDLTHMNPPNPNTDLAMVAKNGQQSFQVSNVDSDSEKSTHQLLSVFDDDLLLQSVLQNEEISAEKLLQSIPIPTSDKFDLEKSERSLVSKPVVSWSDDSEEEATRIKKDYGKENTEIRTPDSIKPASRSPPSSYEEKKYLDEIEATEHRRHYDKMRERDIQRNSYYDSRHRLMQLHVYDRSGRNRDYRYSQSRYHHRDRYSHREQIFHYRLSGFRHMHGRDRDRYYSPPNSRSRDSYSHSKEYLDERNHPGNKSIGLTTESPPIQLNVADSTISDSELSGMPSQENNQSVSVPVESDLLETSKSAIQHNVYDDNQLEKSDCNAEVLDESVYSSPKRLSLDERLEMEMGLNGPLPIILNDASEPSKGSSQEPIAVHVHGRLHSQIRQTGKTIQVVPIEIPHAPIAIRSTFPANQFDVYGNPIGVIPGQPIPYPAAKVVTIKVPVVPFTVQIVQPEDQTSAAEAKRKKAKSERRKSKRDGSSKSSQDRSRKRMNKTDTKLMKKSKFDQETRTTSTEEETTVSKEESVRVDVAITAGIEAENENAEADKTTSDETALERKLEEGTASINETESKLVEKVSRKDELEGSGEPLVLAEPGESESVSILNEPEAIENPEPVPLKKIEILPPPERGILALLGFRSRRAEDKKKVKFADGVDPGFGTSSSGGEEMASPPPSFGQDPEIEGKVKIKKKLKKKKKKKSLSETDLFTPPSSPADPYPFCHPGILYQVCPQYAVLYAQAMAEKGLDVVFEPTTELPAEVKPVLPTSEQQKANSSQPSLPTTTSSIIANTPTVPPVTVLSPPNAALFGIDFSQPPPDVPAEPPPPLPNEFSTPTMSPYEGPSPNQQQMNPPSQPYYKRQNSFNNNNFRRYESKYSPSGSGSKIPTIVTRVEQPTADYSPKLVTPRPYEARKPINSNFQNPHMSPTVGGGKNIEVVTRTTSGATPSNIYIKHEKSPILSSFNTIPPLMSPQLTEEIPSPSTTFYENSNNILIAPTQRALPKLYPAPHLKLVPEKLKTPSIRKALKKAPIAVGGGISIPLSKIVSESTIPSLVATTTVSKKIPALHQPYGQSHEQIADSSSYFLPTQHNLNMSLPQYTSFDSPLRSPPRNSNLINVLTPSKKSPSQQPSNLHQVPITTHFETTVSSEKSFPDMANNDMSNTLLVTPSSMSTVSSGNYDSYNYSTNFDNKNLISVNSYDLKEKKEIQAMQTSLIQIQTTSYDEFMGSVTPPPPGTSP